MATSLLTKIPSNPLPTQQEIDAARTALQRLTGDDHSPEDVQVAQRLQDEGVLASLALPEAAVRVLARALTEIASGNSVTLLIREAELSSNQAADFLSVSRTYLLKLLEEDKLPHRTVGKHRRIRVRDLQLYREREEARREAVVKELIQETDKLGLY